MLDDFSTKVLDNLNSSFELKKPVNANLIDGYILSIDNSTIQQDSYLETFLPSLNQILLDEKYYDIDTDNILIQLLSAILSFLQFKDILTFYPKEFILQNLFSNQSSTVVTILCLKIIILNIHQDETLSFLQDNDIIHKLLEVYFIESTPISVLNQIELLISSLNDKEIHLLDSSESIFQKIRHSGNTILVARYLDLLLLVLPKLKNVSPHLYSFTREDFVKFDDDPLFLILLIQFYEKLVQQEIKALELEFVLNDILSSFDNFDSLVKSEVVNLVARLSYHSYDELLNTHQIFKTHNLIQVFEKNDTEIKLLSRSNPQVIYQLNNSIYNDVLAHLNLFTNNAYFPILLNFLQSTTTFFQLKLQLNNERLSKLPMDKLFSLLLEMAKHEHTKEHLFNNLPSILSSNLLESDIRNSDLWNLKLRILENLLEDKTVPGFPYWQDQLQKNYDIMRFGQSFKNIKPKVDILDETG
ncbi:HSM3 DNA mismatch repair protein HSM3 [Candida maltosa Xu316]